MKKIYFAFLLALVGFCGCSDDLEPLMLPPVLEIHDATEVTSNSAVVSATITRVKSGRVEESGVVYSTANAQPTLSDGMRQMSPVAITMQDNDPHQVSLSLTGLSAGTKYYYRFYSTSGSTEAYSAVRSFTTKATDEE